MYQPPNGHALGAPRHLQQAPASTAHIHNEQVDTTTDPAGGLGVGEMDLFLPRPARALIARIGRALRPQGGIIPDRSNNNNDPNSGVIFVPRKPVPIQKFGYSSSHRSPNNNNNSNYHDDDMRLPRARAMRPVRNHRKDANTSNVQQRIRQLEDRTRLLSPDAPYQNTSTTSNAPGHLPRAKRRQNTADPNPVILQQPSTTTTSNRRTRRRSPSPKPRIKSHPSNSVPWRSQKPAPTTTSVVAAERSPIPRRSRHPSPISRMERNRRLELHSKQLLPLEQPARNGQLAPVVLAVPTAREECPPYPTPPPSPPSPVLAPYSPSKQHAPEYYYNETRVSHVTHESQVSSQPPQSPPSPSLHLSIPVAAEEEDVVDLAAAIIDIESESDNDTDTADSDREDEYSKDTAGSLFAEDATGRAANGMSGTRWSEGSTITVKSDASTSSSPPPASPPSRLAYNNNNNNTRRHISNGMHGYNNNRRAWEVGKQPAWTPVTAAVTEENIITRGAAKARTDNTKRACDYNGEMEWSSLRDFRSGHTPGEKQTNNRNSLSKSGSMGLSWSANNEWSSLCELRVGGNNNNNNWQRGKHYYLNNETKKSKMLPSTWGAARNKGGRVNTNNSNSNGYARRLHTDFTPALSIDKGDDFIEFQTKGSSSNSNNKNRKGKRRILSNVSASMFKDSSNNNTGHDRAHNNTDNNNGRQFGNNNSNHDKDLVIANRRRKGGVVDSMLRKAGMFGR